MLLFLSLWAAACQQASEERILARVNRWEISLADFRARAAFMGLGSDPLNLTSEVRRAVLDSLVQRHLILSHAFSQGIKLAPGVLSQEEAVMRHGLSGDGFEQTMSSQGLDISQWREELEKDLLVRTTLDLVLGPRVMTTPDEIRAYYQAHREEYRRSEQVLAQHALLPTRKLAQILVRRVAGGEDMAQASAILGAPLVDGGKPMWLSRGHMPQELENKVFATRTGSLAGPLASPYGFHVVQIVAKRPAGVIQLVDAAKDIQRKLSAEKMEAEAAAWVKNLRSEAEIWFNQRFEATGKSAGQARR